MMNNENTSFASISITFLKLCSVHSIEHESRKGIEIFPLKSSENKRLFHVVLLYYFVITLFHWPSKYFCFHKITGNSGKNIFPKNKCKKGKNNPNKTSAFEKYE